MPRIKLKQADGIRRTTASYALDAFLRHCQLKNLSPYSLRCYDKNMKFFLEADPEVKYVDEITQEVVNSFISAQMDKGNRVTAINARLRAVNVFLRYCFEQKYLKPYPLLLIKEDETFNIAPGCFPHFFQPAGRKCPTPGLDKPFRIGYNKAWWKEYPYMMIKGGVSHGESCYQRFWPYWPSGFPADVRRRRL